MAILSKLYQFLGARSGQAGQEGEGELVELTGIIVAAAWAAGAAKAGWLYCDGSAVSRTTYAALFAAIGITHGQGDGSTTFNLPDYRGRFLRGQNNGAGRDPDATGRTAMNTGGNTGDNVGSVQADAFKSHTHAIHALLRTITAAGTSLFAVRLLSSANDTIAQATGGNETRPVNANVTFWIKT